MLICTCSLIRKSQLTKLAATVPATATKAVDASLAIASEHFDIEYNETFSDLPL
jgi:hypothetical protein